MRASAVESRGESEEEMLQAKAVELRGENEEKTLQVTVVEWLVGSEETVTTVEWLVETAQGRDQTFRHP